MYSSVPPPTRVFVVGAQRCGTTYLYRLLDGHPDITMARPVRPEPKVFLTDEFTGDPTRYDARMFPGGPTTRVRGEKATSYLERPAALDRIARTFPDAHVVVVVRDPIERALSHYRFTVDGGLEDRSVDDALRADLEGDARPYDTARISVSPYAYVRRGRYIEHLRAVDARFTPERVHVVVYEDLVADRGTVSALYRALGVDDTHQPAAWGQMVNPSTAQAVLGTSLRLQLRVHYAGPNAALARRLGRPLSAWR